jgi:hypothetical protein
MSRQPAYIVVDDDGRLTLYQGDGTEPEKIILWQGPQVTDHRELARLVEELTAWAESEGFEIVVPAYDLSVTDDDLSTLTLDEDE